VVSHTLRACAVIPAQAGIQQSKQTAKRARSWFCPAMPELLNELDSRLRGNDEGGAKRIPTIRNFRIVAIVLDQAVVVKKATTEMPHQ